MGAEMHVHWRWGILVALISPLLAVAEPVTLHITPTVSRIADYQPRPLDELIAQALPNARNAKAATESAAEVLVAAELLRTDSGKVRVLFSLKLRARPDTTDRVAFEFGSTRFGLGGVTQMINSLGARAMTLRDRPASPTAPTADASTSTSRKVTTSQNGAPASDAPFGQEKPPEPPPPPEPPEPGRFRWGISAGAGSFIPGPLVSLGGELRAGWQINRMFSAYASFGGNVGFGIGGMVSATGGAVNLGADAYYYFGVQGEAVFLDMFFVAAGPQLARGGWVFISQAIDNGSVSQRVLAAGGWLPALNLKVGLGLGSRNEKTGRRSQFTLALDMMLLFAPDTVTGSQVVNMSGISQMVDVRGVAVGFAPIVVIGFDGR